MNEIINRVREEKEELSKKIGRLQDFTTSGSRWDALDPEMKQLMIDQFDCMLKYYTILKRRLVLMEKEVSNDYKNII